MEPGHLVAAAVGFRKALVGPRHEEATALLRKGLESVPPHLIEDPGLDPDRRELLIHVNALAHLARRWSGIPQSTGRGRLRRALPGNPAYLRQVRHDMSISGREPRGVLDVVLRGGGGAMRVLVTHFGLRARERRRQVDLLLELLNASPASLVVLLGDFNEWRPRARTLQRLDEHFGPAPKPRTFPSWLPLLRLDRVWVWPRPALLGVQAWRGPGARRASDHLPVVARVATLD